jgi:hypothetical protein
MDVKKITVSSAVTSATLLIIVAGATCFGRLLTLEDIPGKITEAVLSAIQSPVIFLLAMNILLLGHHDFRARILTDAGRFWYQLDAFRFNYDGQSGHRILYAAYGRQSLYYGCYFQ